jgi:DinB superfamily
MTIVPDTKDWTWVLQRACPECGFDTRGLAPERIASMLRDCAAAWARELSRPGDGATRRPKPATWSPLEYGCHVRDVFRRYDQRLHLMLTEDDPLFPNWDQDATAVQHRYGEQDPATVAVELRAAADALADRFEQVSGDQWQRSGARSDGARFTVDTFARYFIHDPLHHFYDVTGHRYAGSSVAFDADG